MRLLIAEDGLDLAEALTVFFEKNQFSVDTVHDGFAAYDYASTGEYDAIVLDVMMPKMDGVQVLQRLREEGVRTPVMMLTAKSGKDDRGDHLILLAKNLEGYHNLCKMVSYSFTEDSITSRVSTSS